MSRSPLPLGLALCLALTACGARSATPSAPDDESDRVDLAHLARMVDATARAARLLADGEAPAWKPGGRPVPGGR
jgi:hypothetical protein